MRAPQVGQEFPDQSGCLDDTFNINDRGVSITLKFDNTTHPRDLKWIGTANAEDWLDILRVKTGLGAFEENPQINIALTVIDSRGNTSNLSSKGTSYKWIQSLPDSKRSMSIKELDNRLNTFYQRRGYSTPLQAALKNLDCIYDKYDAVELADIIKLDEDEKRIIAMFSPQVYCGYTYSAKVFSNYNESLDVRPNYRVLYGGFQISANNMPQGDIYQIPLQRYIGRQNQVHFLIDFKNTSADLGRKGFHKDIVDFCKSITEKITSNYLNKFKGSMRPNTGAPNDIKRNKLVNDWKEEMKAHEIRKPLHLISDQFFLPTKKISLTSQPTREQDVIALFNQLLAGGVIRGITVMSTNERFTYDGLYHIRIEHPTHHHIYDYVSNPLGVLKSVIEDHDLPFISHPEILEYKYSLDGLMEDISDGWKNSNEIGLVVVWETGKMYQDNYHITSLLDTDNLADRQYHGVTHIMTNLQTQQKEMYLIILSELIAYLNDQDQTQIEQKAKYEDY
jgi:hypothetical protein